MGNKAINDNDRVSNVRFRNHFSIVFEKLGMTSGVLFAILLTNLEEVVEIIKNGDMQSVSIGAIVAAAAIFAILLVTMVYQTLIWSKTYISISDGSIIIEKNTLNKKKNTIGIKNISNVNTEQNLFERFIGTCKIKLDTNSMSTAEETDVKIVLKKADAEELKMYLMKLIAMGNGEEQDSFEQESAESRWDYQASTRDIITHGLLSINIISLLLAIGAVIGISAMLLPSVRRILQGEESEGSLVSFIMLGGMLVSAVGDIVRGFVKYHNFKIARRGEKLHISCGLLKKINYTIPVSKINGLVLEQSLFARIGKRYAAKVINIGIGDDDGEAEAFVFPYCSKKMAEEKLQTLLPEMNYGVNLKYKRQPKDVWLVWLLPLSAYLVSIAATVIVGIIYFTQYKKLLLLVAAVLVLTAPVLMYLRYITEGSMLYEKHVLLVNGSLKKTFCFIPYKKIQKVSCMYTPLAKCRGIQRGRLFILASVVNRVHRIPYFPIVDGEVIKEKCLGR